jgi:formylglycine-generating enzyme
MQIRLGAWIIGQVAMLGACGFPRPADVGDDAAIDGSKEDAVPPAAAASCAGLSRICGVNHDDDCCTSLLVPGGMFYRSYDLAGDGLSGDMTHMATTGSFRLDKYEVTVGRFRAFVEAGMGTQASPPNPGSGQHPSIVGSGWDASWDSSLPANTSALVATLKFLPDYQTWTDIPGDNEQRPINYLTWYEAMAFCTWDGGYLPTEAEWNYAAAGGDLQRAFPWSSRAAPLVIDGSRGSYQVGTDCMGDGMPGCATTDLLTVGSKPAGDARWGHSDLGGNVQEWVLDSQGPYPTPCIDCANLAAAARRVTRGGAFATSMDLLRTANRLDGDPKLPIPIQGARCARAP